MSHEFDCLIDTTEMAREVHSVKGHVAGTTAAVVGMQTAVIEAQQDSASKVCQKLNKGFYSLIHSQISQRMATLQSNVDAKLMRLNQQRKQLTAIRMRMERDYQMICSRYHKLFTGLNRNLRQRVTELDRPVLDFAMTDVSQVSNRSNQLVSVVPVGQSESIKVSQQVTASNLKYRASVALEAINRFIVDSERLKSITDMILLGMPMKSPEKELTVPVCLMESNYDSTGNVQKQTYVPEMGISQGAAQEISARVTDADRQNRLRWKMTGSFEPEVVNEFRKIVAASGLDSRRREAILRMFENSPYETLK